jgi:nucleoside 2-deoxyribosyltransferase
MAYTPRVYLAGPIQHANDNGKGWRARVKQTYDECQWIDPLDKYDATEHEYEEWTDEQIVEDDLRMIDDADGLLVHWEEVPTCGTPMEIRYAYANDIFTVVQHTLDDPSPWLTYHAHVEVEAFQEAVDTLTYALWADRGSGESVVP